jgi:anti-sigma factor RsiW
MPTTGPHVDIEALVCYALAELSETQTKAMDAHLGKCPECRSELQTLRESLALPASTTTVGTIQPARTALFAERLAAWDVEAKPERRGAALKSRVAASLGPLLGAKAADRMLQPVDEDGRNLFTPSVSGIITLPWAASRLGAGQPHCRSQNCETLLR